ncbi:MULTISPECIES: adenosylcobalamin-dependent ribonucleoside-diphosphate reductase [Sanguibacteroides]|uniref:adenosylcobalamin-dependent ribonucleoside-diphosphate reductase n=1 Tax=Sanguibacteroides TaxID=1635148 RepID=UPI000697301E|nr:MULTISPECIES: adenosylcobalamin-dependent ribonucleoside-diphosphate reductase [Sanguibacteroides]PXZ44684.1 adenosylcobalamin-dependent ribonucleoside-diphosphate reductase [Sanguibacteroides justesenii]
MEKTTTLIKKQKETVEQKKVYTQEEAYSSSLDYFKGDELAARVWVSKYALKDSYGNIFELNPNDMHRRLASEIARIERRYSNPLSEEEIFEVLKDFKYIVPQGGPMTGIGNEFQIASLSNCFVIGNEGPSDSYGGVMKIDQEQVQLMKRRGGVGHDLSHIRPKGSPVKNSALTSTGIVPFMERYSNSTREVAQDGRRGALMLSVSINHPDSESFIDAKMTEGKVTGANISVKIDDEFMQAVVEEREYVQKYPVYSEHPKNIKQISAVKLWNKIVYNAWKSAEPGILFWDTIIRESVPDCYADLGYRTVSTNPCGEIPLCPYDSCRLLAINLYSYVKDPFTPDASFDYELFDKHVGIAQRIMDDIIDLELEKIDAILDKIDSDPEEEEVKGVEVRLWHKIKQKAKEGRRTGVGITAEGDMLAALGLRYGSDEAIDFSVDVHKRLAIAAYGSSVDMARERGAFKIFDAEREKNNPFILRLKEAAPEMYEEMLKYGRRNIACLTIAPTGTTSLMTQTTSGIEPVFLPVYKRRRKVNPNDKDVHIDFTDETGDCFEEFIVFHHKFMVWMEKNGYDIHKRYTNEEIDAMVAESPYYRATSNDIDWVAKVRMQGRVQKWVDHSISVTVNLPADVTEELVGQLYIEAWKSGCKGCTVYRDGSRSGVLVANKEKKQETGSMPSKRPKELDAEIVRFQNNKEKWIAFIGLYEGKPYEIFTGIADDEEGIMLPKAVTDGKIVKNVDEDGNSRYDFQFSNKRGFKTTVEGLSYKFNKEYWNYAKLISGVLRYGMPITQIVELVAAMEFDNENINTWKNGVERALRKFIPDGTEATGSVCENCGSKSIVYQEGCLICKVCGSSKCG